MISPQLLQLNCAFFQRSLATYTCSSSLVILSSSCSVPWYYFSYGHKSSLFLAFLLVDLATEVVPTSSFVIPIHKQMSYSILRQNDTILILLLLNMHLFLSNQIFYTTTISMYLIVNFLYCNHTLFPTTQKSATTLIIFIPCRPFPSVVMHTQMYIVKSHFKKWD